MKWMPLLIILVCVNQLHNFPIVLANVFEPILQGIIDLFNCCFSFLTGYLYFYHEHIQFEYSYNSRKVMRIMRANSILNC